MFANHFQVEPLVRRADIFEVQGSDLPQETLTPPEVSRRRFDIHDISARRSHIKTKRTLSRGSVGDVSPLSASPKSSPVCDEHASESASRTIQDEVSVEAKEVGLVTLDRRLQFQAIS